MKNKILLTGLLLALVSSPAAWAKIYKCTSGGSVTYSGTKGKGCVAINENQSVSVIGQPEGGSGNYQTENEVENGSGAEENVALTQAEKELQQARKALEDGKKVRNGNEKNYAKYQERIQSLQDDVNAKQGRVNQLRNSGK